MKKKRNKREKTHPCSFAVPICLEEVLALVPTILVSIHTRQRGFSSIFTRANFLQSSKQDRSEGKTDSVCLLYVVRDWEGMRVTKAERVEMRHTENFA